MATIYEIAEQCNISAATVSYVLSGHGNQRRISPATQKRVMDAANMLGYHPRKKNKSKCKKIVAVYWPKQNLNSAIPLLISGISSALSHETVPSDFAIRPYDFGHLSEEDDLFHDATCDAAIIIGADEIDLKYITENLISVPTVLVNRNLDGYSSVSVDHEEAGTLAARLAVLKGHGDVALVLNSAPMYGLNARSNAMLNYCKDCGIDLSNRIFYSVNDIENGYEIGRNLVRRNQLHRVILCTYDMVALGIMNALSEAGISIGDDVQILATSMSIPQLFSTSFPPMTVVDLKMEKIYEYAAHLAMSFANGTVTDIQKIAVKPELLYRESCPLNDFGQA